MTDTILVGVVEEKKGLERLNTGYSTEEIELIKRTVAKGATDIELGYFLSLAKAHNLNPFKKEIWCYKDNKGNLITMVGRDGMLAKAQSTDEYFCLNSCEVKEKDEFKMDVPNKTIEHHFGIGDRGGIVGAYAILETKDGGKTITWVDINDYDKKQFIRNTHKAEMIKKVAECIVLKKRFIFAGLVAEETYKEEDITITDVAKGFTTTTEEDA